MTNISLSELKGVIEKSGLQGGDYNNMKQGLSEAKYKIANTVYGQDTQTSSLKDEYMSKLAKVAQIDQKLSKLYSDPSSKLYIERASSRDNAKFGAINVEQQGLKDTATQIDNRQKELEDIIKEATALYQDQISEQNLKENEYAKTPSGIQENTQEAIQKEDIQKQTKLKSLSDKTGITDQNALDQLNELTENEQDAYIRDLQAGNVTPVNDGTGKSPTTWQAIALWRDQYRKDYKTVNKDDIVNPFE